MIEIDPEWVLMILTDSWLTDGEGLAIITIDESNSSRFLIELALNSLNIEWDANLFSTIKRKEIDYFFEIEDIKDSCPVFYAELTLMEDNNYVKVKGQSSDHK